VAFEGSRSQCHAVLVEVPGAERKTRPCPKASSLAFVPFAMFSKSLLGALAPRCVVAPLFARQFDVLSLLDMLAEARFAGRILVMAPHLPNRAMVQAELQAHCPGLRLTLLIRP